MGATPSPSLSLTKTVTPTTYSAVGQTLTYTFAVTNDGNLTIHDLAIAERHNVRGRVVGWIRASPAEASRQEEHRSDRRHDVTSPRPG